MEQAHTIELEGLEKRFPSLEKPAVASLTTTLRSGAVIGLVGPDGARFVQQQHLGFAHQRAGQS
ncbi:hypothetical protein ISX56_34745, partial [Serratia ureilytica]|nr:hypothetical protein [Serratia ureilytica]